MARSRRIRPDRAVLALLLLAAALRLPGLGARSLWFDEALAGSIARLDAAQVLANAAGSSHPPAHYFLLHLLRPVFGESEYALRFPSACFSLLAVALVARLGRELWGRRVGRLAALGMALSPFQVIYAQEARMYAPAIALGAAITWVFLRGAGQPGGRGQETGPSRAKGAVAGLQTEPPGGRARSGDRPEPGEPPGGRRVWWVYGLLVAVGLYVHYYVALVVLALHGWLLFARGRRLATGLLVADGLAAAAFGPQLVQFVRETGEYLGGVTSWQAPPSVLSPLTTLWALLFGHVSPGGWLAWVWVGVGLFLLLVLLALAVLGAARCGWRSEAWALLCVVGGPPLAVLLVSFAAHSIYSERSFAVTTPALVLLLARAAVGPGRRSPAPLLGSALAVLLAAGSVLYHVQPDPVKPPVREAAALVAQEAGAEDIVLHLQDASYLPTLYYRSGTAGALVDAGQGLWLTPEVYALFGGRVAPADGLPSGGRAWLTVMPGYVGGAQAAWLAAWEAGRVPDETWEWVGVQVRSYTLNDGKRNP